MRHIDPTGYIGPEPTPIELISAMGTNTVAAVIIAAVAIPLWSRRHLWARTASVLLTAGVLGAAVAVARTLITATNQMDALSYITPMAVLGAAGLLQRGSLLFLHGADDTVTPTEQSLRMWALWPR